MIEATDATLPDLLKEAPQFVLIKFWADWCVPCKALAPIVNAIEPNYSGRVQFIAMEASSAPNTFKKYNLRAVPTLLLVDGDGEFIAYKVGACTAEQIEAFLDTHVNAC